MKSREAPWTIDAHMTFDDESGRLWMTWGGGTVYVSEMDPSDGMLLSHPPDPEFDTHPAGTHTAVATWNGDEWTDGNDWFEGAALYKYTDEQQNRYWYFFASYGHLAENYTIRMGRGDSPTGPFYDKEGVGLLEWDAEEREFGNSILLGAEGGADNPGHPHLWTETRNGQSITYMGYDYVDLFDRTRIDRFGIRQIHWVNGWPTVWTPLTVSFAADEYPELIGQPLGMSLGNVGEQNSVAAFDFINVDVESP
ncbi:MAG: family 43 glycosylhydrolase [Chloroflexota bacterium]